MSMLIIAERMYNTSLSQHTLVYLLDWPLHVPMVPLL